MLSETVYPDKYKSVKSRFLEKKFFGIGKAFIFLIAAALIATVSAQSEKNILKTPDQLKWTDMPTLREGAKVALIEGDLHKPGPFTFHLKLPAGFVIPPHQHPWTEHSTVISGTLNMGFGDTVDQSNTKPLPAGSVIVIQPNVNHYSWASEVTIVQVHGIGPLIIEFVNPDDDPRIKK